MSDSASTTVIESPVPSTPATQPATAMDMATTAAAMKWVGGEELPGKSRSKVETDPAAQAKDAETREAEMRAKFEEVMGEEPPPETGDTPASEPETETETDLEDDAQNAAKEPADKSPKVEINEDHRALRRDGWSQDDIEKLEGLDPAMVLAQAKRARERQTHVDRKLDELTLRQNNWTEQDIADLDPKALAKIAARVRSGHQPARSSGKAETKDDRPTNGQAEHLPGVADRLKSVTDVLRDIDPDQATSLEGIRADVTAEIEKAKGEAEKAARDAELARQERDVARIDAAVLTVRAEYPELTDGGPLNAVLEEIANAEHGLDRDRRILRSGDPEALVKIMRRAAEIVFGPQRQTQARQHATTRAATAKNGQPTPPGRTAKRPISSPSKDPLRDWFDVLERNNYDEVKARAEMDRIKAGSAAA